ncbi:MAG: hypothetical protein BGO63_10485 [Candidatus Accumulibacter sp. 66-26]|nr:hypothetical protein [Accumulibacter sp.]OJW51550.1 MAG: hypothetical protein BGO63_10485 [Candidatus Accumulibacter sp. 66-26]
MKLNYKTFPKGDARRYFVALLAVARLSERATIRYVAEEIGCTRSEAQRALEVVEIQFGVRFSRNGPLYIIDSWGVLKRHELGQLVAPDD